MTGNLDGLSARLMDLLLDIEGDVSFEVVVTSGMRTKAKNKAVGGVVKSAHLTGEAADLAVKNSAERFQLVSAAYRQGIVRIGVGKTFVHVDVSPDLPQNVMWHYYP